MDSTLWIDLEVLEEAAAGLLAEMFHISRANSDLKNDEEFLKLEDEINLFERSIIHSELTQESINDVRKRYNQYREKVLSYEAS